jgi:hypothetical protein
MNKRDKWGKITDEVVYFLSKKKIPVRRACEFLEDARVVILNTAIVNDPYLKKTDNV